MAKENHKILVKKVGEYWNYKLLIGKENNISEGNDYYYCTNVCEKIKDFGNAFGQAHRTCNEIFVLPYTKIKDKYGQKEVLEQ